MRGEDNGREGKGMESNGNGAVHGRRGYGREGKDRRIGRDRNGEKGG